MLTFRPPESGISLDADVIQYTNSIAQNGGTIDYADIVAVNTFVTAMKATNLWDYMLEVGPMGGNQTNAAVVKLKAANGYTNLTYVNTWYSTNYTRTNGWFQNLSQALNTRFTNLWERPNTNGLSVWISSTPNSLTNGNTVSFAGHNSNPSGPNILLGSSSSIFEARANSGGSANPSGQTYNTTGIGLNGYTRTASNSISWYLNGIVTLTNTTAQTIASNSQPVILFGEYNFFAPTTPANPTRGIPIGYYAIDSGIPRDLLAEYNRLVQNLMVAFNRVEYHPNPIKTVLIVGQSLAAAGGNGIGAALSTSQSNTLIRFPGGNFIPTTVPGSGPNVGSLGLYESGAETGWRAFGEQLRYEITNNGYASDQPIMVINWAQSGSAYSKLKKTSTDYITVANRTTNVYWHSILNLRDNSVFSSNLHGAPLEVAAIVVCHGEADFTDTSYGTYLAEWVRDYRSDIAAVTGQSSQPSMFHFQPAYSPWPSSGSKPAAALAMTDAQINSSGSNYLVSARYHIFHAPDNVHLTNTSYRIQGERAAIPVARVAFGGLGWQPLMWTNASRSGATITLTFTRTNLTLDTTLVSSRTSSGFTYTNDSSPPSISTVAVSGALNNQITITLASDPGVSGTVRYGLNGTGGTPGPAGTAGAGNLRDQYSGTGIYSTTNLYNWAVIQEGTGI